jgi:hypothetical protein
MIPPVPIILALNSQVNTEMVTINKNRVCSALIGIPYASDNFTNKEWEQFKKCVKFLDRMDGVR